MIGWEEGLAAPLSPFQGQRGNRLEGRPSGQSQFDGIVDTTLERGGSVGRVKLVCVVDRWLVAGSLVWTSLVRR